ncbi:MAG: hypothetical protein HRU38_00800 [Saccharospirillaceae bacterium]|nr:hypothetical protein [Colwellia sp.]NRB77200.1 hypothetical protein [Saccharospirillaceae bacterium]
MVSDESVNKAEQIISLNFDKKHTIFQKVLLGLHLRNILISALLMVLFIVLYLVIFWLPSSVKPIYSTIDAKEIMAQDASKPIDESPWRESQLAKHRRDAQEILSLVLEKQKNLEDKKVTFWANETFEAALKTAESGDYYYRSQEFSSAMASYQNALKQLINIEASIPEQFGEFLAQGKLALKENNANLAKEKLQVAMYMQPNDSKASSAFDRALVLDQVLALVKIGTVFVEDRQYEAAKSSFEQAHQLDRRSALVNEQLQQVNQLIVDRDYSFAMSSGYKKLQQNKYNQALVFFNQAKKIKPTSVPAVQAIKQSKNERMQANISFKFEQAQERIQQEDWSKALDKYNAILLIDKSLLQAQIGILKSTARLTLSDKLNNYIDYPERLSNKNVYQQALFTKQDAMNIAHPGEKLLQQIKSINQLMIKAKVPLLVNIKSDNQTMVTLYRSGQLGRFLAKELSLTPGEYTLVGSRDGFRDVRQAFILYADKSHPTIVIQCSERVTRG